MSQPTKPVRRGLGRGLGALIPTGPAEPVGESPGGFSMPGGTTAPDAGSADGEGVTRGVPTEPSGTVAADAAAETPASVAGAHFREVPIGDVRPNQWQPRQVFDEEALAELVHSIREVGLLQPVVVRPAEEGGYELIMGERRWRATQAAGLTEIPAIVRDTHDDDLLRDALLENLHRSQLNPLEEAAAYDQLLQDFGCTHEQLAERIGRSRPQISNTLRLLKLPPTVQRRVAAGVLSAGHARALLAVDDSDEQDHLAKRIVAEGLSVRAVEEIVAMGDTAVPGERTRAARGRQPVAPGLADLAARLSDRLETRVKVQMGRTKGKITIDVATMDDLERVVALLENEQPAP